MDNTHFILATAGHVDHGKSSLVKALTGTDPDRLPEEKARGITIDLGFAHLQLDSLDCGMVDVPGHEDFVKNMVAGVGSIDLAVFIVAADDGWMPQTEEHLQILSYLGVARAVVALTKIDLAPDEPAAVAALRAKLAETPFANAPIIPTSIVSGRGFAELKVALAETLSRTPPPADIGKPRLPVDRVFLLRGIGSVVTGTLTGGVFRRGQAIVVQPGSRPAKIRSLQNHSRDMEQSAPGSRTAINIPDVASATAAAAGVQRGEVLTLPEFGEASDTLDVLVEKSARLAGMKSGAALPIKDGARVRVHHGSGNHPARIHLLGVKHVGAGERAVAQLRLETPMFAFNGDRFILRDWPEQFTLGGGVILDAAAHRRKFRTAPQRKFLARRAEAPADLTNAIAATLERDGMARRAALLVQSNHSAAQIALAATALVAAGQGIAFGEFVADVNWWQRLRERAATAVDTHHRAHPEHVSAPLAAVRGAIEQDLPVAELFDVLVADLARNGFTQSGTGIRRTAHQPALPPNLQAAGAKVRAALATKPCEPPSRKELAPDATTQAALRFLRDTGEVIELSEDVVVSTEAFQIMRGLVVKQIRERGPATLSDLRQVVGSTRRIMVPLMERLDREGVTVRQGDLRALGKKA